MNVNYSKIKKRKKERKTQYKLNPEKLADVKILH